MKKFKYDSNKQYLKKFRIYPFFLYRQLDKWLKAMSAKGWHVVYCGVFSFIFESGKPSEKEYFTYTDLPNEGKYSISLRYPFLEKTYGKKHSKLSKSKNKYSTIEIDLNKINNDDQKRVGYMELVNDRNKLLKKYFISRVVVVLAIIALCIVLSFL